MKKRSQRIDYISGTETAYTMTEQEELVYEEQKAGVYDEEDFYQYEAMQKQERKQMPEFSFGTRFSYWKAFERDWNYVVSGKSSNLKEECLQNKLGKNSTIPLSSWQVLIKKAIKFFFQGFQFFYSIFLKF